MSIDVSGRRRQSRGIPTGGQFATEARTEPDVTLAVAPEPADWGRVNVTEGGRSPWGTIQDVHHYAPGIASVGTAGHGGAKLSPERNRLVPAALRRSSGWYEEDCEAAIVVWTFPEEFAQARGTDDVDGTRLDARRSVMNWFPDAYEKATGEQIPEGVSLVKDERLFRERHAGDMVSVAASRLEGDESMVKVTATLAADRTPDAWAGKREFLVPRAEFEARGPHGFVIDPARHADVTGPPPVRTPAPRITPAPVDVAALRSDTMRSRVARDLAGRWRRADGSVIALRELLATEGVTGKGAAMFDSDGRVTYYLEQRTCVEDSSASIFKVSKATWDALDDVPDQRTDVQRAQLEADRADHALEKARAAQWGYAAPGYRVSSGIERARKRSDAAHAALRTLREASND